MKFDDDFFKAEVREGFEITSMMKRAWAAQMEVFQVVADVCRKNKLRYFADWGTLLGAVRHKGMIPWEADYVTEFQFWIEKESYKMHKECFNSVIKMPFEHFSVNAPASWDEVLSAEFGDYMTPVIGSADHRYPFYGHMEEELIRQIRNVGFKGSVDEFCEEVSSGRLRV